MKALKFSKANAKLEKLYLVRQLKKYLKKYRKVYSFDMLSGYSCPMAKDCLSRARKDEDGKRSIEDGPHTLFRCFSASQEAIFTDVFNSREHNFNLIREKLSEAVDKARTIEEDREKRLFLSAALLADWIAGQLPEDLGILRIHVAGDFFNPLYMLAWFLVAQDNPDRLFYAYTKSIGYWLSWRHCQPDNFILTASRGGRQDELITEHGLREAVVILHPEDANGLDIDHDDSHAARPDLKNKSFALLIHGQQPAGSEASKAMKRLKTEAVEHTYSRKK